MKKSQLRNIIKQVIKEQQTTPGYICYDFNCLDVTQIGIPSAQNYINNGAPSFPNLNQCLASNCGGNDLCKGCMQLMEELQEDGLIIRHGLMVGHQVLLLIQQIQINLVITFVKE